MKDVHRGLVEDEFPLCRAGDPGIQLPARRRVTNYRFVKIISNFRRPDTKGFIIGGAVRCWRGLIDNPGICVSDRTLNGFAVSTPAPAK